MGMLDRMATQAEYDIDRGLIRARNHVITASVSLVVFVVTAGISILDEELSFYATCLAIISGFAGAISIEAAYSQMSRVKLWQKHLDNILEIERGQDNGPFEGP